MASTRLAKKPLELPAAVTATVDAEKVTIKGPKGTITLALHPAVDCELNDNVIQLQPAGNPDTDDEQFVIAVTGTTRAHLGNMVQGVTHGFEKKLILVGTGYRAQLQGKVLNLSLGFSHPTTYAVPEGITIETPSQTEIIIRGISKKQVGDVAADIRSIRPPEPYKGKGVRYSDEVIILKETKKK